MAKLILLLSILFLTACNVVIETSDIDIQSPGNEYTPPISIRANNFKATIPIMSIPNYRREQVIVEVIEF